MTLKMKFISIFLALLFMADAYAASSPKVCVSAKGLSVGGIGFKDNRSAVSAKLGKPKKIKAYQGEDDGGVYTGSTLSYEHIEIDIDRLRGIERIRSTSPAARLPFGLKPGMPLQKVAQLLHFIPDAFGENDEAILPVCGIPEWGGEMHLHFEKGTLKGVELTQYGP